MKATITQGIRQLGTSLALRKGQTVNITPARNLPQGGFFASPVDGSWGEDSLLIQAEDFRPLPDPAPVRHSIRLTGPNGAHSYLWHRDKGAFAPATARKYLREWLAANPGGVARIEDQFRDPVPTAARLESRARRLYALRLVDPRAPQYALADSLMERARMIRA